MNDRRSPAILAEGLVKHHTEDETVEAVRGMIRTYDSTRAWWPVPGIRQPNPKIRQFSACIEVSAPIGSACKSNPGPQGPEKEWKWTST